MTNITFVFSTWHSFFSYVISLFTFSLWSHVEVVFDDKAYGAVYPRGVGWTWLTNRVANSNKAVAITVPLTDGEYKALREFIEAQVGKKYDLAGVLLFPINRRWQDDDAWFCSELIAAALVHVGYPGAALFRLSRRVTPSQLHAFFKRVPGHRREYLKA